MLTAWLNAMFEALRYEAICLAKIVAFGWSPELINLRKSDIELIYIPFAALFAPIGHRRGGVLGHSFCNPC
jgi:hypothetical protein